MIGFEYRYCSEGCWSRRPNRLLSVKSHHQTMTATRIGDHAYRTLV
jgi:hypothetical protein